MAGERTIEVGPKASRLESGRGSWWMGPPRQGRMPSRANPSIGPGAETPTEVDEPEPEEESA